MEVRGDPGGVDEGVGCVTATMRLRLRTAGYCGIPACQAPAPTRVQRAGSPDQSPAPPEHPASFETGSKCLAPIREGGRATSSKKRFKGFKEFELDEGDELRGSRGVTV